MTVFWAYARVPIGGLCRLGDRRSSILEGGRKVRAPLGRVLGNSQVSITGSLGVGNGKWHRNIPSRLVGIRVKSDGKSVRLLAVTRRRPNPTWSKAK